VHVCMHVCAHVHAFACNVRMMCVEKSLVPLLQALLHLPAPRKHPAECQSDGRSTSGGSRYPESLRSSSRPQSLKKDVA